MNDRCTWHPLLRWLLFLPAGILAMTVVEALLRIAQRLNGSGVYWGECLAAGAEPWAFLGASLWMLPKFHRVFTLLFAVPYICFEALLLFWAFSHYGSSSRGWSEAFIAAIALVSASFAAVHFYRENSPADFALASSTNEA